MSPPTLPGSYNPKATHRRFSDGKTNLINRLSVAFEWSNDAIGLTFWERQREREAKAGARSEARQMTWVERLQRSAQYRAAAVNLRAEAAPLHDDEARPLLALARSYQDRARIFEEDWA